MARETSNGGHLHSLVEAIKASELVETRIELLTKLRDSAPPDDPDLDALMEFLVTLWEGFTCLDVSQCMLNKAILDVAAKNLEENTNRCLGKFLTMGTEASKWCAKHLKMTLMSTGESQEEEHDNYFFQFLLECLKYSVACFSLVIRNSTLGDEALMVALEKFIMEQLNLIKDLISEIKKIQSLSSELLKGAATVLECATKLCKTYSQAVNWNLYNDPTIQKDATGNPNSDESRALNHVSEIIKCTTEKLCELGTLSADGGGSLVTILNSSWKGVVSLLQLGGGTLLGNIKVSEIVVTLISLAVDSLRCAAEIWSSSLDPTISVTEAKRAFLPIKFFLINAVRISNQFPQEAFSVHQEISLRILQITTLMAAFSKYICFRNVCEAVEELLKPTSLQLLKSLLNSSRINKDQKVQILDQLFGAESFLLNHSAEVTDVPKVTLNQIFSVTCEEMPRVRILLLGRMTLFTNLLKISFDLDEDVIHGITRKLQWVLEVLVNEEVYSVALVLKIPTSSGDGKTTAVMWEPAFFSLLHSLKVFMILVSKTQVWNEVELFLFDNFFHPHFLCWEVIMELWCFLVRHAESNTVNVILDKLCSLYKLVACSDSGFSLHGVLRRMARSMCLILASCTTPVVDRVYRFILNDDGSHLSDVMHAALMMEGFQLNLLSENLRSAAVERISSSYVHFIGNNAENVKKFGCSVLFGIQVVTLCSALLSMQVDASCIDKNTLKFLLATVQAYKKSTNTVVKNHCCRLLSETLGIISAANHLYDNNDQMEQVIIELENMFISGPTRREPEIHKCKPALASFMASMGKMQMEECEQSVKTSAIWQLYHMLLSERHWALIHLAISAFGYFAARTTCTQLWRFVPSSASLSFDLESGTDSNEERFMSELKVFLEKEMTLTAGAAFTSEQLEVVYKDGHILKELFQKNSYVGAEIVGYEKLECNKRRKLPDGFSKGMELLQNGLKVMGNGLSIWKQDQHDYAELDDKILTEFSRLENMVNNLAGLADSD